MQRERIIDNYIARPAQLLTEFYKHRYRGYKYYFFFIHKRNNEYTFIRLNAQTKKLQIVIVNNDEMKKIQKIVENIPRRTKEMLHIIANEYYSEIRNFQMNALPVLNNVKIIKLRPSIVAEAMKK